MRAIDVIAQVEWFGPSIISLQEANIYIFPSIGIVPINGHNQDLATACKEIVAVFRFDVWIDNIQRLWVAPSAACFCRDGIHQASFYLPWCIDFPI